MTPQEQLACVIDEIRAYPQPVAAGDVQFDALMQRKAELEELIQPGDEDENACS